MNALLGNENIRVLHFGKRHRVAVTFTRADGMWHAHAALLPKPKRRISDARIAVRDRLIQLGENPAWEEVSDE